MAKKDDGISSALPTLVESGIIKDATRARFLAQKTPQSAIYWRQSRGNTQVPYIQGWYVIEVLNRVFGFSWDYKVLETHVGKKEINCLGELSIRDNTGQIRIVKQQWGGTPIKFHKNSTDAVSIADDRKAAATSALKKCAQMLGIGVDLIHLAQQKAGTVRKVEATEMVDGEVNLDDIDLGEQINETATH